jgi:3-phosphoshikimate 1-carboxyvinyltransferase
MIEIRPVNRCDARVVIPGSKSFTHRALIVSALAEGESTLLNALSSEDVEYTLTGLERLGIRTQWKKNGLQVQGAGGKFARGRKEIFTGNSGTSMRFLTALASLRDGQTLLDGSGRMRQRPMFDLLQGLEVLGVSVYSENGKGYPPVTVESGGLKGGMARIRGNRSSQFLSALLMVAPYAERDVDLKVAGPLASRPYVDITLNVMSAFGVRVDRREYDSFSVKAGQRYRPRTFRIEGDASNASYFFSAAAITRGKVRVENFRPSSVQGDAAFLDVLEGMGCGVVRGEDWAEVRGRDLRGMEINMNAMPDLVPTLAVTAGFARGKTVMKNIGHLRLKESDRITCLAGELAKMGLRTGEGKTWLSVEGGRPHGAEIETHEDHRLAMAFAVAGLSVPGMKIAGERCVEKSFPGFWNAFERLYGKAEGPLDGDPAEPSNHLHGSLT